jgi:hypothetical protein
MGGAIGRSARGVGSTLDQTVGDRAGRAATGIDVHRGALDELGRRECDRLILLCRREGPESIACAGWDVIHLIVSHPVLY